MGAHEQDLAVLINYMDAIRTPRLMVHHPKVKELLLQSDDKGWLKDLDDHSALFHLTHQTWMGRRVTTNALSKFLRRVREQEGRQEGRSPAARFVSRAIQTKLVEVKEHSYRDGNRIRRELAASEILLEAFRHQVWPVFQAKVWDITEAATGTAPARPTADSLSDAEVVASITAMNEFYTVGLCLRDAALGLERVKRLKDVEMTKFYRLMSDSETAVGLLLLAVNAFEQSQPMSQTHLVVELSKFVRGRKVDDRGRPIDGKQVFRHRVDRMCELLGAHDDGLLLRKGNTVNGKPYEIYASESLLKIVRSDFKKNILRICQQFQEQIRRGCHAN